MLVQVTFIENRISSMEILRNFLCPPKARNASFYQCSTTSTGKFCVFPAAQPKHKTCFSTGMNFIDNFNLFWNHRDYFKLNKTELSWIGTAVLRDHSSKWLLSFVPPSPNDLGALWKALSSRTEWTRTKQQELRVPTHPEQIYDCKKKSHKWSFWAGIFKDHRWTVSRWSKQ